MPATPKAEARRRGAQAFFFLGDMDLTRAADGHFKSELVRLAGVPFFPVIGNHEVTTVGPVSFPGGRHAVKEFREDFLSAPTIRAARVDEVAYSVDLGGVVHLIALDNVTPTTRGPSRYV